jgi:hypothetical protein
MEVSIKVADFNVAVDLAKQTLHRFSSARGHYNNTFNSHLRGKIGEIVVHNFLRELGLPTQETFKDLDRMAEADIVVPGSSRIEVKTWSEEFWPTMGRCIAVDQFQKLRSKADLIIWCVSARDIEPNMRIEIAGWNLVSDVPQAPQRLTGPPNARKVNNYQLDAPMLRQLKDLKEFLSAPNSVE